MWYALTFVVSSLAIAASPEAGETRSHEGRDGADSSCELLLYESLPADFAWNFGSLEHDERLRHESLAIGALPIRYTFRGFTATRTAPYAAQARRALRLPAGEYLLRLQTPHDATLSIDGRTLLDARLNRRAASADSPIVRERLARWRSDGLAHDFAAAVVLDPRLVSQQVQLSYKALDDDANWRILGLEAVEPANDSLWDRQMRRERAYYAAIDDERVAAARRRGEAFWERRHAAASRRAAAWPVAEAPPIGDAADESIAASRIVDAFLRDKMNRLGVRPAPLVGDLAFLRRLTLDLAGRIPTRAEIAAFEAMPPSDRRQQAIERLLASSEWADAWMGYWQDVLAENPSILKPHLNNSGPFRFWIHKALVENLPMDRFVTELVLMEGPDLEGGTSGFGLAADNDLPSAMKAHIVGTAFLGIDLKCARCHDSPVNAFEQRDLFSLAALLDERSISVPATSIVTVPDGGRVPAVTSSLAAGQPVPPLWTLVDLMRAEVDPSLVVYPERPRARMAATIVSAETPRFTDVLVNRVWKRLLGIGLVEPVDNWSDLSEASHAELLRRLSRDFVLHGYDLKWLARQIVSTKAYARTARDEPGSHDPALRTFAAQTRRRMSAEQVVDSMFVAVGKDFDAEELTFDPHGTEGFLGLGQPRRAWQYASLSNERDRPALAMPVNQSIVDVLQTFGWRENRTDPVSVREEVATPLQPLMLANGGMASRVVRLCEVSAITELCLVEQPLERLVDELFLTVLSRLPDEVERHAMCELLADGFETRRTGLPKPPAVERKRAQVDWDKHLESQSSLAQIEYERRAREGDAPTVRLSDDFRQRVEDALWCLLNTPEFVFVP